jgi:hypothetical protein
MHVGESKAARLVHDLRGAVRGLLRSKVILTSPLTLVPEIPEPRKRSSIVVVGFERIQKCPENQL